MTKLNPPWAEELLRNWAEDGWREAQIDLGLPKVCPSFRGLTEISDEVDVGGYSPAEVKAIAAAVDHIKLTSPDHYRALSRHFRPWTRGQMQHETGDDLRLQEAVQMIADYVDKTLG